MLKKKEPQRTYEPNIEAHSRNHYCRGKATSISYTVCVFVALGIQHEIGTCSITLLSVACRTLLYFCHIIS